VTSEPKLDLPPGVKLVRTLRGHTGWIGRIAWSPDGKILASPSADGTIRLWDPEKGQQLRVLEGHEVAVFCAAFDARSRYVTDEKLASPECFISYAWGNAEQERWVEHSLATDLLKAGVTVVLDRWETDESARAFPGSWSVSRNATA
jgi:WD domain, G-beta repeat/SEFIR domain